MKIGRLKPLPPEGDFALRRREIERIPTGITAAIRSAEADARPQAPAEDFRPTAHVLPG
jgi:hypothetical protein